MSEALLEDDPRFRQAVVLFNAGQWYACHDGLEELWHETLGPDRTVLQGILQIAVAHLHLERGNQRGATMLLGEGVGRLARSGSEALGLDLDHLCEASTARLRCLQAGVTRPHCPCPACGRSLERPPCRWTAGIGP